MNFFYKMPLLLAAVFLFSAQSIKLKSLTPLPEDDYGTHESSSPASITASSDTVNDVSAEPVKESTGTAAFKKYMSLPEDSDMPDRNDMPKKTGKGSLKDFVPMKEGTVVIDEKEKKLDTEKKGISLKNVLPAENSQFFQQNASRQNNSQYSKDSYSKKKTVHLKNFNPEEEKEQEPVTDWKLKTLPHFKLYYEQKASKAASVLAQHLETSYQNMRLHVEVFPQWMANEPVKIYLYASREAYLKGEFHPDAWSKGIAFPSRKIVILYPLETMNKLLATCSHELTHVYFESFFSEQGSKPPLWLNEGLAVFMENQEQKGKSEWDLALRNYPSDKFFNLPKFFYSDLSRIPNELVSYWYLQSFSIVSFLKETGTKISFRNFCYRISRGEKTETLLWEIYRFSSIPVFQSKLMEWIASKSGNNQANMFSDFATGRSESGKNPRNIRSPIYLRNNASNNFKSFHK